MNTDSLTHFRFALDDGIAVVTMDRAGEDLNTLDPALMEDFAVILERLEHDDVRGVVLISAKPDNFLAGANIKWFSSLTADTAEEAIRQGHVLFARLEELHTRLRKPVVAAIHGACLGGGNELALACSYRIATDDPGTILGQPEVQLGVIPAGGGTQRLPRVVGVIAALDLILTGKSLDSRRARKVGLVDEVVPASLLLDVARRRAAEELVDEDWKDRLSIAAARAAVLEKNPLGQGLLFRRARSQLIERTKGHYPAPELALEAVRIGIQEGSEAGYDAEARFFAELVTSSQSRALRSIFFATRRKPDTSSARPVEQIGVLGGGLMGAGIATVSTMKAGSRARIKEVDEAAVARARAHVAGELRGRMKRRRMSEFEAEQALLRVTGSTDWSGFGGCDLIIEAVFEDLELKRSLLREVEGVVSPDTVFASNTSSIPIARIAEASTRPETVLGMHYFSPVEKMPLLEVIVTSETAAWAEATAVAYGFAQGKNVIVVSDGPGFYTTRILGPYTAEAFWLLSEGARIEDIDGAMEAWGFPVGPLRLADEVGIDVGAKIAVILAEAFGERMTGPDVTAGLVAADRKGRKNRRGLYQYGEDGKRGGVDDTVYADLGVEPTGAITRNEIQERMSLAMINEAARCLDEGILRSPADGDLGAVMGLGFPPFRGGPFFWAEEVGRDRIRERLRELADVHGPRFDPTTYF